MNKPTLNEPANDLHHTAFAVQSEAILHYMIMKIGMIFLLLSAKSHICQLSEASKVFTYV